MCKHEEKKCPRCEVVFECKPGNIGQCQCYEAVLTPAQRSSIAEKYSDCLCVECLRELASAINLTSR